MADLPDNTTYDTGGSQQLPDLASLIRGSTGNSIQPPKQTTQPNPLGAYTPIPSDIQDYSDQIESGKTGFGVETPIGAPSDQKIFAPPAGYSPYRSGSGPLSGVQPVTPAVHQVSFGGQYNIDTSNPQNLIKQDRYLPPHENQLVLGPLSQSMFQVDHIVPLWAGGADTLANKQNLPIPVHDAKTRIQAVPETLYYNGDLTLDQARAMALNWQDRSADGIPEPDNTGGIPLDTARAIAKKWQSSDQNGAPVTLKGILKGVPDAADNLGKSSGLPEWARQFLVGTAAGATMGAVPLHSSKDATVGDKIAGFAGETLGAVAGFMLFDGLTEATGAALTKGALGGLLARVGGKLGITAARGAAAVAGDTVGGASMFAPTIADAIKGGASAAKATKASSGISGILSKTAEAANPQNILSNLKTINFKTSVSKAARNAVTLGTFGQASQTLADFTEPQRNELKAHVDRLSNDLLLGGITGFFPGSWRGSTSVGAGTFALGMMSGDSPRQALSNAVALSAMHKVGGFAKDPEIVKEQQRAATDDTATKGAFTVLHNMVGDKPIKADVSGPTGASSFTMQGGEIRGVPKIDINAPAPTADSYTPQEIQAWTEKALDNLNQIGVRNSSKINGLPGGAADVVGSTGGLSTEQYFAARARIMAAAKWLQTRQLPDDTAEMSQILDLSSMAGHLDSRYDVDNISTPNSLLPFVNKMDEIAGDYLDGKPAKTFSEETGRWSFEDPETGAEGLPENNGLRGTVRLTGQAASLSNESKVREFIKALDDNTASPILFGVRQPEMAPMWRDLDRAKTKKMLDTGDVSIDQHPENFINVFGLIRNPDGTKQVVELGARVPSKERIGVPGVDSKGNPTVTGNKYAFNKDPDIVSRKFPQENADFNKDTIGFGLSNRNLQIIPMKVAAYKEAAIKSGKPYIVAKIDDTSWNLAKQIQEALGPVQQDNNYVENLAAAKADMGRKDVEPYIEAAATKLADKGYSAPRLLQEQSVAGINVPRQQALIELTGKTQNLLLESKTPEQLTEGFEKDLGVKLRPDEAEQLLHTKENMTAGGMLRTIETAIDEGRASPLTAASYEVEVKPFLNSQTFKNSEQGMLFDKMPVLSQEEAGGALAMRVSTAAAEKPKKSLLDQDLIERPAAKEDNSAAYDKALNDLQVIGNDTPGLVSMPLDAYTDRLVDSIKNARVSPEEKKKLGEEAMKLINRSEMDSRDVSSGLSAENWDKNIRGIDDVGKYIQSQRDRFTNEFGSEDRPPVRTNNPNYAKDASDIVRKDVEPYWQSIEEGKKADPTTYKRGHDETFDALAKAAWGPDYQKNYGLMKLLTDKTKFGRAVWTGERMTNRGTRGGLLSDEAENGKQIGQPKDIVAAAGTGDRDAMKEAMARRNAQNAAKQDADNETPKSEMDKDVIDSGLKPVDETQDPSENIQDLTNYEAEQLMGMLDEIERGTDPQLSPVRGMEDAATQIFSLVRKYNESVRNGDIKGSPVKISDARGILDSLKDNVLKKGEEHTRVSKLIDRARDEIASLEKRSSNLEGVGGSRAQAIAKEAAEKDAARIQTLKDFIEKAQGKMPDGQGGPGLTDDTNAPITSFDLDSLQMPSITGDQTSLEPKMPVMPKPQTIAPSQPSSTISTTGVTLPTPKPPKLETLDLQTPSNTVKAVNDAKQKASSWFQNLSNSIANAVDKVAGNTSVIYNRADADPNAVIEGIDTTSYATDPNHAVKLNAIVKVAPQNGADKIDSYIRKVAPSSPVTGSMVASSAARWGVPANLLLAIIQNDSSFGTKGLGAKTKNPGNVGNDDAGNVRSYQTWAQGVDAVAQWMANHKATELAQT